MAVSALRDRVVDEYRESGRGFVSVTEAGIRRFLQDYFELGKLWPEPLGRHNSTFKPGRSGDQFVRVGDLRRECATTYRRSDRPDLLPRRLSATTRTGAAEGECKGR